MNKVVCVIPARYGSSRFPGKVLANLLGKPMIQHVCEQVKAAGVSDVLVATDSQEVVSVVENFGAKAIMTSPDHQSGTDRIYEAISNIDADIIINVQGDEPLIPPQVIRELAELMQANDKYEMATVAVKADSSLLTDPNKVKVVFDANYKALYFSRAPIPYLRDDAQDTPRYLHWGIYAYRRDTLEKFVKLPASRLENCEKLEQLRAMENGIAIQVMVVENLESVGVDTPEDLKIAEEKLRRQL